MSRPGSSHSPEEDLVTFLTALCGLSYTDKEEEKGRKNWAEIAHGQERGKTAGGPRNEGKQRRTGSSADKQVSGQGEQTHVRWTDDEMSYAFMSNA